MNLEDLVNKCAIFLLALTGAYLSIVLIGQSWRRSGGVDCTASLSGEEGSVVIVTCEAEEDARLYIRIV